MNIVKLKGLVNGNPVTRFFAERVLNAYVLVRHAFTHSYTKYTEDYIVGGILKFEFGIAPKKVKYVDIGANDYRRGNNSYLFYTKGARGLLVEANPLLCKNLEKKRPEDNVKNVAIGTTSMDAIDFYVMSLTTRSSMNKESVEESIKNGLKVTEVIKVPCVNINDLFKDNDIVPDYLSIDIEGMDFEVLKTVDFDKYKIKVIVAETDNEEDENGVTMQSLLESHGYVLRKSFPSNSIYVLEK